MTPCVEYLDGNNRYDQGFCSCVIDSYYRNDHKTDTCRYAYSIPFFSMCKEVFLKIMMFYQSWLNGLDHHGLDHHRYKYN